MSKREKKIAMDEMCTPLKMARNTGSSHHGTGHWWAQRLTSIALVPLSFWFVFSIASLNGAVYEQFTAWLGQFGNALMMILFVIVMFYHVVIGIQVVVEDYVHGETTKNISLIVVKFLAFLLAVGCILSVIWVSLGG